MTYEEARQDIIEDGINLVAGDYIDVEALADEFLQALEKVVQLEEENKKMRSALRKFCFNTLCSQCPFIDDLWVCTLSKLVADESGEEEC